MNLREIFQSVQPTNVRLLLATLLRTPTLSNRLLEPVRANRTAKGQQQHQPGITSLALADAIVPMEARPPGEKVLK